MFELVAEFQFKVLGNPWNPQVRFMSDQDMKMSEVQLKEEVTEMMEAYEKGDLVGTVDACLDLMYFVWGILYRMGVSGEKALLCFQEVHRANMGKVRGVNPHRLGLEGADDAYKPQGWKGPEEAMLKILCEDSNEY